jgi:glycosyltransferase involved in cell wall biosynthesis
MPKVSICIPTYNTARYLPETIESVLAQDFTDYELVICDDVSSDNTPEICARYNDPRIRYIRYRENAKQAGNFNRCLDEAQSEFLAILHADDFWLPGFLADRVKRLTDNPKLGFVFGTVQIVDADSNLLSTSGRWPEDHLFEVGGLLEALLFGCIVCPPSLMVRKASADRAGKFRTDLTWGHDWEWALRLAEQNAAYFASEPLAAYRVHDGSGTAEQLSAAKNGFQERRILQDTFARLAANENRLHKLKRPAFAALSRRHMYFAEQSLLAERRAVARNNLWYAALADASMIVRPTYWALLLGSVAPINLYNQYRALRGSMATPAR